MLALYCHLTIIRRLLFYSEKSIEKADVDISRVILSVFKQQFSFTAYCGCLLMAFFCKI